MRINIETIPHKDQRYETCGDWWVDQEGVLQIRVSDLGNPVWEWLVAEHEINEFLLCQSKGIEEKTVSDYDIAFEKLREQHPELIGDQEPGDMIAAPYNKQHIGATTIERLSAAIHNVDWKEYDNTISAL